MGSQQQNTGSIAAAGFIAGIATAGIAAALLWRYEPEDVRHYREVRDYTHSNFVRDLEDDEILRKALHGLADGLDSYSQYFDVHEAQQLERETAGRYSGLGIVLKRPLRDGRILFPLPDSPAIAAGLRAGDSIVRIGGHAFGELLVAVDGHAEKELDEKRFHAIVGGAEPKIVPITVLGLDGRTRDVEVTTGSVLEPTVKHEHIVDPERGIGYVAITSFSHETPGEFFSAFDRLRSTGMRALVLDLRGDPGGVLNSAIEIAQRFVPEGVIVSTEGRGERIEHRADSAKASWTGFPLVVLVDRGSASASEVLAAALHDHRVAVLVGSPTYGKGVVQTIHRFPDSGAVLKLTTSYYYTPAHKNLERRSDEDSEHGIQPDVRIDVTDKEGKLIHDHLASSSPSAEVVAQIAAWEQAEAVTLLDPEPRDVQLAAAIELFAGKRPGPHAMKDAR